MVIFGLQEGKAQGQQKQAQAKGVTGRPAAPPPAPGGHESAAFLL